MAITIKCPDCGHTKQSDDGEPETCPECEGTMAPPPKKKYQAKSSSLEEESRAKSKPKRREDDEDERPARRKSQPRDEDEEDEERPAKKKAKARADDDDDNPRGGGDFTTDGKAAAALDLNPGFKNKELMKQVKAELSRGEVLHFVCRPCLKIAKMQGIVGAVFGAIFAIIGLVVLIVFVSGTMKGVPVFAAIIPALFVLVGLGIAVFAPIAKIRQAKKGWYAVTDRRAIVFHIGLWGSSGHAEDYPPAAVRKMWIKKSFWVKGAGDLVFRTEVTHHTRTERDSHGRTRTTHSTSTQHFGFLGVEDVKDIETLLHEILLSGGRRSRDDDDEDDD